MTACEFGFQTAFCEGQYVDIIKRVRLSRDYTSAYRLANKLFSLTKEVCRPYFYGKLFIACQFVALQFCNDSLTISKFVYHCGGDISEQELGAIQRRVLSHVGFDLMGLL